MNVQAWLQNTTKLLSAAGIDTARLDALVLLEDALHTNRTQILAYPDTAIPVDVLTILSKQLERRLSHTPLAYIRGKSEFYGREFTVSPAVLEPRPESETIIELLLSTVPHDTTAAIADVGTGSGALGITAALELPQSTVELLEIDNAAIAIAKTNVTSLTTGIKVIKTNLLANTTTHYDILLCNLPYVPEDYVINQAARHEPRLAIFGGPDGLDLYRQLFQQIALKPKQPLLILTESLPAQHSVLSSLASSAGYVLRQTSDFIQAFELN